MYPLKAMWPKVIRMMCLDQPFLREMLSTLTCSARSWSQGSSRESGLSALGFQPSFEYQKLGIWPAHSSRLTTCFKAKPFAFLKIKGINNSLYLSLSLSFSWCECWHYDAASQPAHWPNPKNKRLTHIVIVPTKLTKRAQICQQRMKHKVVLIQFVQIEVRAPVFLQLL